MSTTLRRVAKRLLKRVKDSKASIRSWLKQADNSTVKALSEISLNIKHGVIRLKKGVRNSATFIKKLADKTKSFLEKKKLLITRIAVDIVKALITAAIPVLTTLSKNG